MHLFFEYLSFKKRILISFEETLLLLLIQNGNVIRMQGVKTLIERHRYLVILSRCFSNDKSVSYGRGPGSYLCGPETSEISTCAVSMRGHDSRMVMVSNSTSLRLS